MGAPQHAIASQAALNGRPPESPAGLRAKAAPETKTPSTVKQELFWSQLSENIVWRFVIL